MSHKKNHFSAVPHHERKPLIVWSWNRPQPFAWLDEIGLQIKLSNDIECFQLFNFVYYHLFNKLILISITIPIPNTLPNGIPNMANYFNFLKHVTFPKLFLVSEKVVYVIMVGLVVKNPYSRLLYNIFYTHTHTRFCGIMHD